MKIKVWVFLLGVFLILSLVFLLGRLSTTRERNNLKIKINNTISQDSVVINGLKNKVYSAYSIIENQNKAIKDGLIEREKLKKLNIKYVRTNTKLKAHINILKDSLKNHNVIYDTLVLRDTILPVRYMGLPANLTYKDNYANLKVNIDTTWGFKLLVPLRLDITVCDPKVIVTTDNPYVSIDSLSTVIVPDKKEAFKHVAIGTGIGLVIAAVLTFL